MNQILPNLSLVDYDEEMVDDFVDEHEEAYKEYLTDIYDTLENREEFCRANSGRFESFVYDRLNGGDE